MLLAMLSFRELRRAPLWCLGGLWLILAAYVTLVVARETLLHPWSLTGSSGTAQVYFSPTCPSCREVVLELLDKVPEPEKKIAFIPISKNAEDDRRLAAVLPLLREGGEAAIWQACPPRFSKIRRPGMCSLRCRIGCGSGSTRAHWPPGASQKCPRFSLPRRFW